MNRVILTDGDLQTIINALTQVSHDCDAEASKLVDGNAREQCVAEALRESAGVYNLLADRLLEADAVTYGWEGGHWPPSAYEPRGRTREERDERSNQAGR